MKPIQECKMRDVKAMMALDIANRVSKEDRIPLVKAILLCADEDEARQLISRGRRLAREMARAA